ncbi:YopX family protein [Endozoicomonas lisbonensis]|uniref:Phage protein (TIGR01671 family) n=1 Tax=Endozoicomonas lisbonensis TaxID=3120522 RepID=A0ABV2SD18_9GAMM
MRFKFKAWHDGAKSMIPHRDQGFEGDVFNWLHERQPITILQFTGLKDKQGTDIYEGDIVRIAGVGNCKVEWDCCGYWAFGTDRLDYQDVIEDIESVVGNIYETPELLE